MSSSASKAMTVLGPIDPDQLGVTLPHEHLQPNGHMIPGATEGEKRANAPVKVTLETVGELARVRNISFENLRGDDELILGELAMFREVGGSTIVDLTCPGMGRDVPGLQRLSRASGVNVITATGRYCAPQHPPEVASQTVDELASSFIDEISKGIEGTDVRAGVIKIGISPGGGHPDEWKVVRAAAAAQQETDVAISVHNALPFERMGMRVMRRLIQAGADPERVIMGHMTQSTPDIEYHRRVADTGAMIEFDKFGTEFYYDEAGTTVADEGQVTVRAQSGDYALLHPWARDSDVVLEIAELVRYGYADQILLSHDCGRRIGMVKYGGYGLRHVPGRIVRYLHAAGVTPDQTTQMTVDTPRRLFSVKCD